MSIVILSSGGLDSTLIAHLSHQDGIEFYSLFVDYGQICASKEYNACLDVYKRMNWPTPIRLDISGYGKIVKSGLTDPSMHLRDEAFLPGRNLLFILAGAAYAAQNGANAVAIGILNPRNHLFTDQTQEFLESAEIAIRHSVGKPIKVVAPLMHLTKGDVIKLAATTGICGTYSCHAGTDYPCGECVSCLEVVRSINPHTPNPGE